ncbi:MAG: hypothetical protein HIU88_12075 [Acidobacteria bacterium]|nr:hypothetical protein [Acidobacteriota bacterium]
MWYDYVWVLVPVVAILAWGARGITRTIVEARHNDPGSTALTSVNERLAAIDTRLAAVESTLNDIP